MDNRILEGLKPTDRENFNKIQMMIDELLNVENLHKYIDDKKSKGDIGDFQSIMFKEQTVPFLNYLKSEADNLIRREVNYTFSTYNSESTTNKDNV